MTARLVVLTLMLVLGAAVLAGLAPTSGDPIAGDAGRCPAPLAHSALGQQP